MTSTPEKCRKFPLRGKNIYMHFETGARPSKSLEKILRVLGASISQFFDRKIDYVITNLPKERWPLQPTVSPGCSSKENVDPRSENSPQMSTGTHPSPSLQNSPLGVTRGRAMLLAAKKASKPSVVSSPIDQSVLGTRHPHDVLLRAQEFGIKVLTVDVVRKWVRALPEDVKVQMEVGESPFLDSSTTSEPDDFERDRLWLLRPLARPCIKIVDQKARTRPCYMEKTNYMECLWRPFLDSPSTATISRKTSAISTAPQTPTTPAGTSTTPQASVGLPPSTNVITSQRTTGLSKRDLGAKNSPGVSLIRSSYKGFSSSKRRKFSTKRSQGALAEPSGYCECCLSRFDNLYTHVTGTCHMNYAENVENFRQLDQLLFELPSMGEALAKARGVKVVSIAPPPDANASASPNGQIRETSPQPTHTAHESIGDSVLDFSALPPLPTPSVPQYPEGRNSSAPQLFSESDERSNISIVGNLPSPLFVGEASPTRQLTSINVPATYSPPFPPLTLSPSITPVQGAKQTATMPLSRESTCPPLQLHATPLMSQSPILQKAPPIVTMGSPMAPSRIGTCTVQEIISSIVIASPTKDLAAAPPLPPPQKDTSPVLKKRFRKCTECQCMHVPTEVPIQLRLQMMALFGPLAMLDDFCPRLSLPAVISAPVNPAEYGGCPANPNKKPKCGTLSCLVSSRNGIPSGDRLFDLQTVNQGSECVTTQSPNLLVNECVNFYAPSNDQDFQLPMVENSSSDEKGNVDVVRLSPPLEDEAENPPSVVVDQEHELPQFPVLLSESMSPIEMHNEPASVSLIMISSDGSKEAKGEKVSENTLGGNQTTAEESVDGRVSPLEQSIADVRGGDRYPQCTILRSYSCSLMRQTRRRREARRRNTEPIGRASNEVFSFGSYGDLGPNFGTGPDSGATRRLSEPSSVDNGAKTVTALPSPLLCPVLSSETARFSGLRQQGHLLRRASLVARQSISLSLQALYTPMKFGSDRAFCFDLDPGNASQVAIGQRKRSHLSSQVSGSKVSLGPRKRRRSRLLVSNGSSCNSTHPEEVSSSGASISASRRSKRCIKV